MEVIKIETIQKKKKNKKNIDNKTNIYYDIFKRKDIAKFTYQDYLYIERQKTIHCSEVKEEGAKYETISSNSIHNVHDKTYRKILSNKTNATYVINKALNLIKPIEEEEIEKYTNRYITNEYTDKETDIVYKLKNNDIYFLIEHQSSVDYSMSFRLEEYKLEIMKSAIDKEKVKTKEYEIPTVIPIVLYTGKEKWKARRRLNKVQDERLEKLDLQQYNLIDISKYTKEDLLKSDKYMDKIFLIEKFENVDELRRILPKVEKQLTKEQKNNLISIIRANLKGKVGKGKVEELIKEMKGEDEDMLGCVEMVWKEGINKGMKEGKKMIINSMIKKGIKIEETKGEDEDMLGCVEMVWEEGVNKGMKEGIKEGINKGKKEERLKIAIEMKKNGLSTELIQKITRLKKQAIEKIEV